jgi:hypothetical protein
MVEKFADLTGRWLGRYEYPDGNDTVPFEAELAETLDAILTGQRDGMTVLFAKRYLGFQEDGPIGYEGTVDAALSRIEGHWSFALPVQYSGRFVMMRKPLASARAARRQTIERASEFTLKF